MDSLGGLGPNLGAKPLVPNAALSVYDSFFSCASEIGCSTATEKYTIFLPINISDFNPLPQIFLLIVVITKYMWKESAVISGIVLASEFPAQVPVFFKVSLLLPRIYCWKALI